MKKKRYIPKRSSSGVVMAELALTLPILLVLLFTIIEVGNLMYTSNSVNQVARTAARYAATHETYTIAQLKNFATQNGADYVIQDINLLTLTIIPNIGTQEVGDVITVTATYAYQPFINPFNFFTSGGSWSPTLVGIATSRSEVGA